jgi:hypothetical protein
MGEYDCEVNGTAPYCNVGIQKKILNNMINCIIKTKNNTITSRKKQNSINLT